MLFLFLFAESISFLQLLLQQAEVEIRDAADEALERIKTANKPRIADLEVYRNCVIFSFTILKGYSFLINTKCLLTNIAYSLKNSTSAFSKPLSLGRGQVGREQGV